MNKYTLTKYQQATVNHLLEVYRSGVCAYIVADEVGLGKTYIALGLIENLKAKRIIYIASNMEIAKQNTVAFVDLLGLEKVDGDRLSMMSENKYCQSKKYIMSLSPATTFTGKGSDFGDKNERDHYQNTFLNKDSKLFPGLQKEIQKRTGFWKKAQNTADGADKDLFTEIRAAFNMRALEAFEPDLIIMDEFHRFHEILDPEKEKGLQFNLWNYVNTVKCDDKNKGPKILLLSATPYKYSIQDAPNYDPDEAVASDNKGGEDEQSEMDCKPFENLEQLITYMSKINGKKYRTAPPDICEMYNNYLCRTERQWLTGETQEHIFEPSKFWEMDRHFDYVSGFVHERLKGVKRAKKDNKSIIDNNYNKHKGFLGADYAVQDYLDKVRGYIDVAPEYTQFAYKYQSVIHGGNLNNKKSRLADGW